MILVDTSVWIRALARREPWASELDRLLARDWVVRHDFVYGELLAGDMGGRVQFLAVYERMRDAGAIPHNEVVVLAKARRLHGRGAGWADIHLLASALAAGFQLWTADTALTELANELGIAYRPSGPESKPHLVRK